MNVTFECIICGDTAAATVPEDDARSDGEPVRTLRECPTCEMETIWIES
jgi:hypothetical protein